MDTLEEPSGRKGSDVLHVVFDGRVGGGPLMVDDVVRAFGQGASSRRVVESLALTRGDQLGVRFPLEDHSPTCRKTDAQRQQSKQSKISTFGQNLCHLLLGWIGFVEASMQVDMHAVKQTG